MEFLDEDSLLGVKVVMIDLFGKGYILISEVVIIEF